MTGAMTPLCMVAAVLTLAPLTAATQTPYFFYAGSQGVPVPQFYVYNTQLVAAPTATLGTDPACTAAGFFADPNNCSRFFRCVDYAGTGQYFSRYDFQCPAGQMFLAVGKDTCVPGNCPGVVPLPVAPTGPVGDAGVYPGAVSVVEEIAGVYPEVPPAPQEVGAGVSVGGGAYPQPGAVTPQAVPVAPAVGGGAYPTPGIEAPQPGTVPPSVGGGAYPQPGTEDPQPGTVPPSVGGGAYPQPGTVASQPGAVTPSVGGGAYPQPGAGLTQPGAVGPAIGGGAYPQPGGDAGTGAPAVGTGYPGAAPIGVLSCAARYVQDPLFCNIYARCPADGKRYVCSAGSVFDQARQMCRLNDREDVCTGKSVYNPASFRAGLPFFVQPQGQQFSSFYRAEGQQFPTFYQGQGQQLPSFYQNQQSPLFYSQPQQGSSIGYTQPFVSYSQFGSPVNTIDRVSPGSYFSPPLTYFGK